MGETTSPLQNRKPRLNETGLFSNFLEQPNQRSQYVWVLKQKKKTPLSPQLEYSRKPKFNAEDEEGK